ncbi:MAG: hypothetical protein K8F92_03240 [Hyphomicrobium sp.]|uniref:hypothetical protein n=1 Tax=Hyphomicrobium sp. TaxID=82 RepID=UPI001321E9FE|nr:hypothetical protein [Hyphomicrobium sp.]KAB2939860.1 MAG: hypothetical protein F9K20_15465 [Hyphomicrobium sp.]MBZ0208656.1 hypothetical protein [Hyphomicrobium sp.]
MLIESRGAVGALCLFGRLAQRQYASEVALQVDSQHLRPGAISGRVQRDALDRAPDNLGGFLAAAFISQRLAQPADLFAVAVAHPGMDEHGTRLRCIRKKALKLGLAGIQRNHPVFDLDYGRAAGDGIDKTIELPVDLPVDLAQLRPGAFQRGNRIGAQPPAEGRCSPQEDSFPGGRSGGSPAFSDDGGDPGPR